MQFDQWLAGRGPYGRMPTAEYGHVRDHLNGRMDLEALCCDWTNEDRFLKDWPNLVLAVVLPDEHWEEAADYVQSAAEAGFRFVFFSDGPVPLLPSDRVPVLTE